jgi:hypothetical protein
MVMVIRSTRKIGDSSSRQSTIEADHRIGRQYSGSSLLVIDHSRSLDLDEQVSVHPNGS